jgi:hypothetical protein
MKHIVSTVLLATSLAVTSAHAVIVGASVGYLTDAKDEYIAARVGTQFGTNQSLTQIGEFEIGFTSQSESGITADFMPITLNYRVESAATGKFGTYAGVGAGMAMTKVKAPYGISADNWSFAAQGLRVFPTKFPTKPASTSEPAMSGSMTSACSARKSK